MENKIIYMNNNMNKNRENLENICNRYIEEELNLFFKSCSKAAYAFSMMVAKDCKSYSREAFESMVVPPREIDEMILRINGRICRELELGDERYVTEELDIQFDVSDRHDNAIDRRVREYKLSDRITAASENVIGNAFSFLLGDAFSSNIVDYLFSKAKIGERLLGENNRHSRTAQFQKEIHRHIEGSLINMKTKLKNELTAKWIRYINDEENTDMLTAVV